jgi:hypothetical protein
VLSRRLFRPQEASKGGPALENVVGEAIIKKLRIQAPAAASTPSSNLLLLVALFIPMQLTALAGNVVVWQPVTPT